jgi:hypothetical protein
MVVHSAGSTPDADSPERGQANSKEVTMRTDKRNPAVHASTVIPAADTMMAMVQDEYGEAEDVLRLEQIDRPEIADGQVLVRVDAAGLDRGVWHAVAGVTTDHERIQATNAGDSELTPVESRDLNPDRRGPEVLVVTTEGRGAAPAAPRRRPGRPGAPWNG